MLMGGALLRLMIGGGASIRRGAERGEGGCCGWEGRAAASCISLRSANCFFLSSNCSPRVSPMPIMVARLGETVSCSAAADGWRTEERKERLGEHQVRWRRRQAEWGELMGATKSVIHTTITLSIVVSQVAGFSHHHHEQ
jgi:hypothetical protein